MPRRQRAPHYGSKRLPDTISHRTSAVAHYCLRARSTIPSVQPGVRTERSRSLCSAAYGARLVRIPSAAHILSSATGIRTFKMCVAGPGQCAATSWAQRCGGIFTQRRTPPHVCRPQPRDVLGRSDHYPVPPPQTSPSPLYQLAEGVRTRRRGLADNDNAAPAASEYPDAITGQRYRSVAQIKVPRTGSTTLSEVLHRACGQRALRMLPLHPRHRNQHHLPVGLAAVMHNGATLHEQHGYTCMVRLNPPENACPPRSSKPLPFLTAHQNVAVRGLHGHMIPVLVRGGEGRLYA